MWISLSRGMVCIALLAGTCAHAADTSPSRYVLLHAGEEVLDTQTRLIWKRCAAGMSLAQDRCTGKPLIGSASIPASPHRTPWRLPTQSELLSLVLTPNPNGRPDLPVVDEAIFPDTPRLAFEAAGTLGDIMETVSFLTGQPRFTRPLASSAFRFVRADDTRRQSTDQTP